MSTKQKSGKVTVVKGAVAQAAANPASPFPAAVAQPAVSAAAPAPVVVTRGLSVSHVKLTGKPYRIVATAKHTPWWTAITTQCAKDGPEQGSVAAIVAAGVPTHFIGYVIRRGYLAK